MGDLRKIGNFELIEKIGQGGMGTVFKARQISMDRIVALKILPPSLAKQAKFTERFMREARASARLNHPNVVTGIDVGQENGIYYFAMEFIEGSSLKDVVKKERLSEERALVIGKAIAQALAHAHGMGIIHRDVKPDNILIDTQGVPKLCDLGLARSDSETEEQKALTQAGQAVGTPHYISPEQARGERNLDAKTDLYSLGATLYHALCGVTMFTGNTSVVIMTAHIAEKAALPSLHGVQLSKGTLAVLAKLLAKDRADRYASAEFVAEDMERVIRGKLPLHAELPGGKNPFAGSTAPANASSVRKTTGPLAPIEGTEGVAERARQHREAMRQGPGLVRRLAPVAIFLLVCFATAKYFSGDKKVEPVAVAPKPVEVDRPPVGTPPAPSPAPAVKKDIPAVQAEVKPPLVPPVVQAPAPPPKVVVTPEVETPLKAPEISPMPEIAAAPLVPEKVPESVPEKTPPPVPVVKAKEGVGPETAALISKAVTLANESRFAEAAELFKLMPSKLEQLDAIDSEAVKLRADAYAALVEMKLALLDRLKREPDRVESDRVFATKRLGGKIAGGDDKNLKIRQAKQFEVSYKWHQLSIPELGNLCEQTFGSVSVKFASALGTYAYDRGEDSIARKYLEGAARANPAAQTILKQIEDRDQLTILKRAIETDAMAEKLMNDIENALNDQNFAAVITKVNQLKAKYGSNEKVKARATEIEAWLELAKIVQAGGAVMPGNVALSTNGATIAGPGGGPATAAANLIDGVTKGYTGGSGFAIGAFPCEWTVTLAKPFALREIRMLLWDQSNRSYRYQIETSMDGTTFTMLADHSKEASKSWQTVSFPPRLVKAIKLKGLYNSANGSFHAVELEAYCIPPQQAANPKTFPPLPGE